MSGVQATDIFHDLVYIIYSGIFGEMVFFQHKTVNPIEVKCLYFSHFL